MKNPVIGGIEITEEIVNLLSDLQEPSQDSNDAPRINHYIRSLSDIEHFFCRKLSEFDDSDMREASVLLKQLVLLRDDLNVLIVNK